MKYFMYIIGVFSILLVPLSVNASTYPAGCSANTKYSSTTGLPCATKTSCQPGELFDSSNGHPCGSQTAYIPGCTSLYGYSITTGRTCNAYVSGYSPLVTISPITSVVSGNTTTFTYSLSINPGSIIGMSSTASIDGTIEPNGDINDLSQQEINKSGGTDQSTTFNFAVSGLTPGSHTLRIVSGGQTQTYTFITV